MGIELRSYVWIGIDAARWSGNGGSVWEMPGPMRKVAEIQTGQWGEKSLSGRLFIAELRGSCLGSWCGMVDPPARSTGRCGAVKITARRCPAFGDEDSMRRDPRKILFFWRAAPARRLVSLHGVTILGEYGQLSVTSAAFWLVGGA